jgi:hypothetical protein
VKASLGQEISSQISQSASIVGGNLEIMFDKVILTQLGLTDEHDGEGHGKYKTAFTMPPYLEKDQEIAEDEYRFVMVVNK